MNSIYTIAIIFQNKQNLLTAEIQRIREERSNSVNSFSKCLKSNTHFHPDMGAYEFEGSSIAGDLTGDGILNVLDVVALVDNISRLVRFG